MSFPAFPTSPFLSGDALRCIVLEPFDGGGPREKGTPPRIPKAKPLFAWDWLEDSPALRTVQDFIHALPDAKLLHALRSRRGHGRDDYPITALWGVCVLYPLLRYPTVGATLADLRRNRYLRGLIDIKQESDLRRFPPIPRATRTSGREYKGCTSPRPDR